MSTFEEAVVSEGLSLFKDIKNQPESLFDLRHLYGRMMDWALRDQSFKVDLFRLVDVLPSLNNNDQIAKHVDEYLIKKDRDLPLFMDTALKVASLPLTRGLLAHVIKKNVMSMAERFIIGSDIASAKDKLLNLYQEGASATIDLLGEKTLSEEEANREFNRYQDLIKELPLILGSKDMPNISLKISALSSKIRVEDPSYSVMKLKERVLPLLRMAKDKGVFVNFDLENYELHEISNQLFLDVIKSDEFIRWPHLGIVVQAYLINSDKDLSLLIAACKHRKAPITVRLVKGAYWDYEVVHKEHKGISCPVFVDKAKTDLNYEELSKKLLDNKQYIDAAFGSHNLRSLAYAIAYAKEKKLDSQSYEIQMLYGMADLQREALINRGHRVRVYAPVGEMLPGLAYLVRRLLENTSQMSFLRLKDNIKDADPKILFKTPILSQDLSIDKPAKNGFYNEGFLDFTKLPVREQFKKSLLDVENKIPISVPIVVNAQLYHSLDKFEHFCPNDEQKKITISERASIKEATLAIECSMSAMSILSKTTLQERQKHLESLADILLKERMTFSSLMCFEVAKTWAEADADVLEAIDYCRYYSNCAFNELSPQSLARVSGEQNTLYFRARGPSLIIAPWNFPLAILCGMSVAAYVTGNPIIMKPSEQSSAIAYVLYQSMIKAGFLKEAVQFLPGRGEEIASFLVKHPWIANIAFTGSMQVGHQIMKEANTVGSSQIQMKRVICEMGGKNAIIVDDDADIDEAISGIIQSTFSYAGQKCSATSRLILVGHKDNFINRLKESVKSLNIGSSILASTNMGPVINKAAEQRLKRQLTMLKDDKGVQLIYVGEELKGGYYVPPTLVLVNDSKHWVMQNELFGPILAIYQAINLDEAISVANDTAFALTGAFYSRSPANIELIKNSFRVGNLYINQKSTGATVARQPFGGFKMSGTGIKAGGQHYLKHFVDEQVITENTMRRGFTPEVSV